MSKMWEGFLCQMLYLMTPTRQSAILDAHLLKQQGYLGKGLPCPRISASIVNFVRLVDPGFSINSLQPLKLWVPSSLLPPGLVIQGRIRLKKRAKNASRMGDSNKCRKVIHSKSSTEWLEQPESSSMGSNREDLDRGQVSLLNDSERTLNQVIYAEGGDEIRAKPWLRREVIDLTNEDGAGSVLWFGGEVIDLTEEGEDNLKPETLVGGMGIRSATPWVDGDYIDLTI